MRGHTLHGMARPEGGGDVGGIVQRYLAGAMLCVAAVEQDAPECPGKCRNQPHAPRHRSAKAQVRQRRTTKKQKTAAVFIPLDTPGPRSSWKNLRVRCPCGPPRI